MKKFKFLTKVKDEIPPVIVNMDTPLPDGSRITGIGGIIYNPFDFQMVRSVAYTMPNGQNGYIVITQNNPLWNWEE